MPDPRILITNSYQAVNDNLCGLAAVSRATSARYVFLLSYKVVSGPIYL